MGGNVLQQGGEDRGRYLQLGEGEHLLAEVFQRGSDVVDVRSVDNQEAVVALLASVHPYRGILATQLLQVQLQPGADCLRVDVGLHSGTPLAEHQQHRFVHVVVYQQQGLPGGAYQVGGELVGIEDLVVIKDALHGRQRGADEEVYLPGMFRHGMLQFRQAAVHGVTPQQVFLQHAIRSLAELCAPDGLYTVAYGNDYIEVVARDFAFHVAVSFLLNCQVFLDSCSLL